MAIIIMGNAEFLSSAMTDRSPLLWWVEVDGLPYDARQLPVEIQVEAYLKGIIPYVPHLGRDGTASLTRDRR